MTSAHIFDSHRLCVRDMKQMTLIFEDSPGHVPSLIMEEIKPLPLSAQRHCISDGQIQSPSNHCGIDLIYKTQSRNLSEGLNRDIHGQAIPL